MLRRGSYGESKLSAKLLTITMSIIASTLHERSSNDTSSPLQIKESIQSSKERLISRIVYRGISVQ